MTTTINNEHKELNFSSEREQSQACLNSAEHEKNQGRKVLNVPNSTDKGKTIRNVPHLRFPEFQGEWTISLLSDFLTENKERNKKGKFGKADVLSVSGDYGIVNQIELLGRSFAGASVLLYHIVRHGNIVYTKSPLKEYPYGIVKANTGVDGIVSTLYAVYNINNNADAQFIEYYFSSANRTNRYFKPIVRIGAKHDMKIGNQEVLANKVTFPNLEEQNKIASLFRLLDNRIATQNKIIEDLKKLKSAISESLFKDIKGDVVMLSEVCGIIKGKQINGEFLSEKGKYYVMNGGTEPSGYYNDYNVGANTISISEGGNSCGYVQFNTSPFWSGGHCYTIQKIADNVDNLYLYHYLKSKENAIMKLRIGSGLPNIQKKDLAMFKIKIPTVEQQKAISTFLSSLERKAEIEESIQNAMQKQKLHLLQQMFI